MSKNLIELPFCKKEEAEALIRQIARDSNERLLILDHARDRMDQRGITLRQVHRVLKDGERLTQFEWDTVEDKGWKCKFCRIAAGVKVTVVAKLVSKDGIKCLVVTVW